MRDVFRAIGVSKLIFAVCLAAGAQQAAKPSLCSLHVHVTDEDGKDLPKAFVLVHGEHGNNQQFTPDKTGQVKNHSLGMRECMTLFVSAMGFVPQAQIVDLRACKPVDLEPDADDRFGPCG